jgi:hypothetical protein
LLTITVIAGNFYQAGRQPNYIVVVLIISGSIYTSAVAECLLDGHFVDTLAGGLPGSVAETLVYLPNENTLYVADSRQNIFSFSFNTKFWTAPTNILLQTGAPLLPLSLPHGNYSIY